jgi:protein-tyrosine-phosphatase
VHKILFVCTANICRSPLAEAIFERKIMDNDCSERLSVESAGIWATDGIPPSKLTQTVAVDNDLDLSGHKSKAIDLNLINSASLIFCMTSTHKRDLVKIFPHFKSKIFTLKEFGKKIKPTKISIDDPIGMSYNFYKRIFSEINEEIIRIWPEILKLINEHK